MGSVKDLSIQKMPLVEETGIGRFVYSDRYSVFDWGEMPNHIENKGAALCIIGAFYFEKLEEMGIKTHYIGIVDENMVKKLSEIDKPVNTMEIKLLRVVEPEIKEDFYDYSVYKTENSNFLIPLEIIYRNSLPEGSSIFKRLADGSLSLENINLEEMPKPGQRLNSPVLDVSTKLESTDRYISWDEAQKIAGLSTDELENIKKTTLLLDDLITKEVEKLGLIHEDGKVEFGFDENRNLILVDVLGTPDECRFTYQGLPVSKEITRIFYRNTPWHLEIEKAKEDARIRWKELVKNEPPLLPLNLEKLVSFLYQACCNEITGRTWFEVPLLQEILGEIKAELAKNNGSNTTG